MRGMVPPDPDTKVSEVQHAVIYMPKRNRKRFSANCVQVVASREAAIEAADPANKRFAAEVLGPSKSSEGQYIFYLVAWID
jgi:hypothetical protein